MAENISVIRITKASPREYTDKIALLEQQNFSAPWTKDMLLRAFADREKVFFAAICDGELAGYIGAQLHTLSEKLHKLSVHSINFISQLCNIHI